MTTSFIKKIASFSRNIEQETGHPKINPEVLSPIERNQPSRVFEDHKKKQQCHMENSRCIAKSNQEEIIQEQEKRSPKTKQEKDKEKYSWIKKLRLGLYRSSQHLGYSIGSVFSTKKLNEEMLQELEDVLIQADLGLSTSLQIIEILRLRRFDKDITENDVRSLMREEICKVLKPIAKSLELDLFQKPHVILVVGVNGSGKTTTIGKLAAKLTEKELSVMLAAGDTFRAAAIEQLHIWGERIGVPVVSSKLGSDASGIAFTAYKQAKLSGSDVLIIDTAGRLQNKTELMAELAKIVRVLRRQNSEIPHTVLQTLDATTGQNALEQVKVFKKTAGVNGLVMTKLDGTARGGILVSIAQQHRLPVYFVGVGEGLEDLSPFSAEEFSKIIVGI